MSPTFAAKGLDWDMLLRYLRLQASMRVIQLGYVGSDFSVHLPLVSPPFSTTLRCPWGGI
jgi:hypothetical protein